MGRFPNSPPEAVLPRGEHPAQAGYNPNTPDVPAELPTLPMIPVENFAGNLPEGVEDHLADFFDVL